MWQQQQATENHFHNNIDVYTQITTNIRTLRQNTTQILAHVINCTFVHPWMSLGIVFGLGWYYFAGRSAIPSSGEPCKTLRAICIAGAILSTLTTRTNSPENITARRDTRFFISSIAQFGGITYIIRLFFGRLR